MIKLLEMRGIDKSFGPNQVLSDVGFDLHAGEVHALIGENGAGKSTLMKILMGDHHPDAGQIEVDGRIRKFASPHDALAAGIAMIHQELNPVRDMSIAENIFLGRELRRFGMVNLGEEERQAARILEAFGIRIHPSTLLRDLTISEQQMIEIAKNVSYGARIIIMDEPTSAITDNEVAKLFASVRLLKSRGIGIVYTSHKMDELFEISDRITVLRDGRYIGTLATADTDRKTLIRMMVGREITEIFPPHDNAPGEEILGVDGLGLDGVFHDISFRLHKGEKLGIAGLMGAGRTELVMTIFGHFPRSSGSVRVRGNPVDIKAPWEAIRQKIALVTEDRKLYGLNLIGTVRDNIISVIEKKLSRRGIFNHREANLKARQMIEGLNIKVFSPNQLTGSLSGGNQQKVVLAKWLLSEPEIIIFDEPTRGIDVGAKAEIYKIIQQLARDGKAVMIISSEMPELIGLADRVMVMRSGRKTGELAGAEITQENIMTLATLDT